jgi:hypothetical protein
MNIEAQVMIKRAKMPATCEYTDRYHHVALVLVDVERLRELGRRSPAMISVRARGMVEIVEEHDRLHVGETDRSEGRRIVDDLRRRAAQINQALSGVEAGAADMVAVG